MTGRKFYAFNSTEVVAKHVSQIKTIADLKQLFYDIVQSETNLTRFYHGKPGVYEVCCFADDRPQRHLFMTQEACKQYGGITDREKLCFATITILEPDGAPTQTRQKLCQ